MSDTARLVIPHPGVRLADLARSVYAAAGAGDPPDLQGDEQVLADRVAETVLGSFDDLSAEDQAILVDTASVIVDQLYAHLPLKRARYAIDPIQRLRLLRRRCGIDPPAAIHRELSDVFTRLRDAHTRYVGPTSLDGCVAYLPFLVEEYGPAGDRHYVVSFVAPRSVPADSGFVAGVEALSWNGVPFARAVEVVSDLFVGSHADARRARGIESLTQRALQYAPLPDEHWVIIGYRTTRGTEHELRFDWRVFVPDASEAEEPTDPVPPAAALGVDLEGRAVQRSRRSLFAGPAATRRRRSVAREITSTSDTLAASVIDSRLGKLGYLRIWNFSVPDDGAFVQEVKRVLERMPDRGLIIDVRNNPGGLIWAAERMLQLLTPSPIQPTRFSLPVSELTRHLANDDLAGADLVPWQQSIEEAVGTGEAYSRPVPLTDVRLTNDLGQCYGGPVVCIADARTYSSGDLFSAGFIDNEIGPLITVGAATGGGGANVWTYRLVQSRLRSSGILPDQLPDGCTFSFAFRRATRAGSNEGRPIEDVGVSGSLEYVMTRRDVMNGNVDLLATAVDVLATQRHSRMKATVARDKESLSVRSSGIEAMFVTIDGSSTSTVAVDGARTTVDLPDRWDVVDLEGWGAGQVLQRRRINRDR